MSPTYRAHISTADGKPRWEPAGTVTHKHPLAAARVVARQAGYEQGAADLQLACQRQGRRYYQGREGEGFVDVALEPLP